MICFFFKDTAPTEIYTYGHTLSLHDALPIFTTPLRQVEAEIESEAEEEAVLAGIERASLEREAKRFAARQGYVVDWDSVAQLDDETLVNGIAQVAPFDAAAKQALLEATPLDIRAELVVQMTQFFGRFDGEDGREIGRAAGRER